MRVAQTAGARGSLKWMQRLTSLHPDMLNTAIREAGGLQRKEAVRWVSPREEDEWTEYRDHDFLEKVDCSKLTNALSEFWPRGGPQWHALGVGSNGTVFLVEAKAHRHAKPLPHREMLFKNCLS